MHAKKTELVQLNIGNAMKASSYFNADNEDQIPIVLIPSSRLVTSCCYHIPAGVSTIVHNCGDDAYKSGLAPTGLQMCKPYWNHIAYMVTQQSCTYNAPVKSCPTKDNVMVDCELTLVFSIGPDPQDVKNFVYNLGALKFNEFLAAETEEAIRQLVRSTRLEDVYELRGSAGDAVGNVLKVLNDKFAQFGVSFTKAAITDVVLNPELRRILQGTTEFKTKINELQKEHEHNMKVIRYDFDKRLAEKEKYYDRQKQDIDNDIKVALVNREKLCIQAESKKEVDILKIKEIASVQEKKANAQLNVVIFDAKKENEKLLANIKSNSESRKIEIDKECQVNINESEKLIDITQNECEAKLNEAQAEGNAIESLKAIREYNIHMEKLKVNKKIANKIPMVISGQIGDKLIANIVGTS